jgi:parvulin-like peptidyl-prolyl isomerase
MQKQRIFVCWLFCLLAVFMLSSGSALSSEGGGQKLFATVDGYDISEAVYLSALQLEAKKRYYHGRITDERLAELKKDVARDLIDQVLLIHEAERLGLVPDIKKVELALEQFDQRYAKDEAWQKDRDRALPLLRKQFESRELVALLEAKIRSDFVLNEGLKKSFYEANSELFVFPERKKVSLILKKVSPSASTGEWQSAEKLLASLADRVVSGESFSELAKEYSDDETAPQGGDMGYQHKGMLHGDVEKAMSELDIGVVSQPIRLLQGYVLVRVEEVLPAQAISYADSEPQIVQLLSRKLSDERWTGLLSKLRNDAVIIRF